VGIRQAGYIRESDGQGYLLDNNDATPDVGSVRGFWAATTSAGLAGTLQISGVMDGFTGLTAGAPIYAGDTAGGITQTRPTPTLDGVQVVVAILGVAISATEIYVRSRSVEYLKRVALDNEETVTITHHTDPAGRLRETWAYVSQSSGVSAIIEYASGNQDNDYALRNQIVATYGADQTTGGTASASTSIASPSAAFADDGNGVSNSWVSAVVATAWLKYDFGVGVTRTIRRYTIIEQASFAARAPQDWTFEGSNDDSNWDVLDTVTGETGWSGIRTFDFVNDTGYRYYRINISENNGDAYISIGEMQMQEAATFTTSADELAQTITLATVASLASVIVCANSSALVVNVAASCI
ncbi:MAG: discoidin domain-containing protein, partial [Chloroflexota bacterium]